MSNAATIQGPHPAGPQKGAAAAGGGTFVATFDTTAPMFLERAAKLRFTILLTNLAAAHLQNACVLQAECCIANKNATVTLLAAIAPSTNPMNSNTAAYATATAEASDAAFATSTAAISIVGNRVTVTVTNNNGGGIAADVVVSCDYMFIGGST